MRAFALCLRCVLLLAGLRSFVARGADLPVPSAPLLSELWPAHWITDATAPKNEYGDYFFRKQFELAHPEHFLVHVTADARYRLWINGRSVSFGPQRSDIWVTRYDSVDLAPWLQTGANVIAAQVWSYGEMSPYAVTGVRTGLLVQGDTAAESMVNSDATWVSRRDDSRTPLPIKLPTYIVVGAGERLDSAKYPWGWLSSEFDTARWTPARVLGNGNPYARGTDMDHWLKPRTVPPMEESSVRFERVRRAEGVEVGNCFLTGREGLTVPANATVRVLLDQAVETNAFPELTVSGGKGARVKLVYAEALVDDAGKKGNRDEVQDRKIIGVSDEFLADGGDRRVFAPLDFRTYRYVELQVETADQPLRIDDFHGTFTGYPFEQKGSFESEDPQLARIWATGWRTARLCAFETYMDCPYYEQLQYVGDTRIQSLISLYASGDDRLMRNAIELFDRSRIAEGLTQSRYPSVTPQVINTFSLFWIDMVHDYWMHRQDDDFVRARVAGIQSVLDWFERKIDPKTGLLGPLSYWTFVDWTAEWSWDQALGVGGEPEGARTGGSSIVSLQLAGTLQRAAELCRTYGRSDLAERYEKIAAQIGSAVKRLCWDNQRQLFADSPAKKVFSQHANTLAVLNGVTKGPGAAALMRRVVGDRSLIQCSTYFRFYLLRAMKQAGLGDEYLAQLGPWHEMLGVGLTTFAEQPDPTRSDCHAWSASPVYELLATVCGVEPGRPGFSTVRIEPHLGTLKHLKGTVPHPRGEIRVTYTVDESGLMADVSLPVEGAFVWHGQTTGLHSGRQVLHLK